MLEIKKLCAGYGKGEILHNVSLEAREGCLTVIAGPNGCGKSTLLKCICGLLPAVSGEISLEGEPLVKLPKKELAKKTAYLPQNRQIPDISVKRLVLHGRFPYLSYPRRYREEDRQAAYAAMEKMELLELADIPLGTLSGGQRQRAYIAMALAQDTPVILLDEPTGSLDLSYQLKTLSQARALADEGKHVLMVIHDIPQALETADHIVLMDRGTAAAEGRPEEIYEQGCVEEIFGIGLSRVRLDDKWRYICTGRR